MVRRRAVKFELSLFALEAREPAAKCADVARGDAARFEGFAGCDQAVLSDAPSAPCAGQILASVDLIL